MHTDADKEEFRQYIEEAEKKLNMKINLLSSPIHADNRHARISTILSSCLLYTSDAADEL